MDNIRVTEDALKKINQLQTKEQYPCVLRVGVRGGGCSGLSYFLEFQKIKKDNDITQTYSDVTIVCDPKSMEYIKDMEIWFDRNLLGGGLKFRNPNAKKTCSCGESFSI